MGVLVTGTGIGPIPDGAQSFQIAAESDGSAEIDRLFHSFSHSLATWAWASHTGRGARWGHCS